MSGAIVLAAALAAAALVDRTVLAEETQPLRPELQRALDGLVSGSGRVAPGATAYVSGPNGTWLGSAGVANVRTGEPMAADARMRLESVSKIYTAALILRLAQDGRLRIGDTVERWLPGLLPYGERITIRQLLTMSSGLIDNNDIVQAPARYIARVEDARLRAQLTSLAERVTADPALEFSPTWWIRLAARQPLLFEPGTQQHYSNIGYDVLGLIAARAGGEPYPRLVRERIVEPLGLRHTAYDPQGPIAGPHARGYSLGADGSLTDATAAHAGIGAEGGIVANAEDTAAFLTGLMRGELVDARQLRRMRFDALWRGGSATGCAGPAYGWSGGGAGYKTDVWVNHDGSRVAVLLLNARVTGEARGDRASIAALQHLYCAA